MPNSTTVRISKKSKKTLEELSKKSGEPMMNVLEKAIDGFHRRMFLEDVNRAYARLRDDTKASKEFDAEINEWDTTMADGLDKNEKWSERDREPVKKKRQGK